MSRANEMGQSLFALSDGVMPKDAGRPLFIGLIFILLVATFASAMAIPTIGKYWNEYLDSGKEDQDTGKGEYQTSKKMKLIPKIPKFWSEHIDSREDDRGRVKGEDQVNKKNNGKKEKREKVKETAHRESRQKRKNTQTEKTPGVEIDPGQGTNVEEVKGKEKEGPEEEKVIVQEEKKSREDEVKPEENEEVKQENGAPKVASMVQSEAASSENDKKARTRISAWFHRKRRFRFRGRIAPDEEQGDGKSGTPN
jgi:lipopolysaccharide export LptBFGC system permease protein LptF